MAPRNQAAGKARRQKKRKSRTEVSSDSDSSPESEQQPSTVEVEETSQVQKKSASHQGRKEARDAEINETFIRYYMQRATTEFEEDLDKIRGAEDFKGDALALLIAALQQGTNIFSREDQQQVVAPTKSTD